MSSCYIIGAGDFEKKALKPQNGDIVIAADGGYAYAKACGCEPDMTMGDFDSLGYVPLGENVVKFPAMKDDPDMLLCVKAGLRRGYKRFLLLGGTGGRVDHTIANLQVLQYIANSSAIGFLIGPDITACAIKNSALSFSTVHEGIISIFSLSGETKGVYLSGLKYLLTNAVLKPDMPLGLSNEFTGTKAEVKVSDGMLTVIWQTGAISDLPEWSRNSDTK